MTRDEFDNLDFSIGDRCLISSVYKWEYILYIRSVEYKTYNGIGIREVIIHGESESKGHDMDISIANIASLTVINIDFDLGV